MTEAEDFHRRLDTYLERTGLAQDRARVIPLTGDASDRRYVRVIPRGEPSFVLQIYSEPFDYGTLPFVNVLGLLRALSLPVPAVLGHEQDLGVLALQDLGDVTLQAHVGAAPSPDHAALYRQAVAMIATLQRRGAELASPEYLPYRIAFDTEKFTWELDFFVKHFLVAYRGCSFASSERSALHDEFQQLIDELVAEPRVLCHRDYHSRNLMLHEGCLHLIDFQDARLGPDTYDLASLVRDSYVDQTPEAVDDLVCHFLSVRGDGQTATEFRRRLDMMALQRNLKALGTFGYQTTTRCNPVYIQYMPRTLRYVRNALHQYGRFERLLDVLASHLAELR